VSCETWTVSWTWTWTWTGRLRSLLRKRLSLGELWVCEHAHFSELTFCLVFVFSCWVPLLCPLPLFTEHAHFSELTFCLVVVFSCWVPLLCPLPLFTEHAQCAFCRVDDYDYDYLRVVSCETWTWSLRKRLSLGTSAVSIASVFFLSCWVARHPA